MDNKLRCPICLDCKVVAWPVVHNKDFVSLAYDIFQRFETLYLHQSIIRFTIGRRGISEVSMVSEAVLALCHRPRG